MNKLKSFVHQHVTAILRPGWISTACPWFSPKDLEREFGSTRQYWCKLIRQGKLNAHKTAAAPIVTTEDLVDYYYRHVVKTKL